MNFTKFKTNNADGTQKTCKFCGEHVWWDWVYSKWYNPDGVTPHSKTCEKRQKHGHEAAMDAAEVKRQKRREGL